MRASPARSYGINLNLNDTNKDFHNMNRANNNIIHNKFTHIPLQPNKVTIIITT